ELENTMHRAVLLSMTEEIGPEAIVFPDGTTAANLAPKTASSASASSGAEVDAESAAQLVGRTVAEVEKDLIIDTLKHCLGNRTHAANILGISIRTLRNKLNLYQSEGSPIPAPGDERAPVQ
ncbi:MAG: hypothetical protein KAI28_07200, partial [Sphingomonadales bacterium]|nr:hypothetical protein [Sphingomonadales bacterium]